MEITVKEFQHIDLIAISGRVDSVVASRLAQALEAANHRGKYKIVIDMSQLEYMSSAGFRALGDALRNSKHHNGGEVILAEVPENIREALDLVGFTEYFNIFENVTSAFEYAENLPSGDSAAGSPLPSPEN
jgi:anti-sigma B factor antagonist